LLHVPFQFLVYFQFCFVLFVGRGKGVHLSRWLCWFIPGVAMGIPHNAYFLTFWSAGCFPSRFGSASGEVGALLFSQYNGVWRSLYQLGVQSVEVLILLGVFFCQEWLQHLSKIFDLQSSCHLLLYYSRHLEFLS
jgi:hypothetical protein